jgi:hypothetical protein
MTDEFTGTLNRFCCGLSEKIAVLAAEDPADPGIRLLAGDLLTAIRETIANLLLLELECERVLGRG